MVKKKIGIYLGVQTFAGGMFQYAQSILFALSTLNKEEYEITVLFIDEDWRKILSNSNFNCIKYKNHFIDRFLSNVSMFFNIPYSFSRFIFSKLSLLVRKLDNLNNDIWIFPAQEIFSHCIRSKSIGTIHDLMHRYEKFPEVNSPFRFYFREYRFKGIAQCCSGILVDSDVGKSQVIQAYNIEQSKIYVLPYVAPNYIHNKLEVANFDNLYNLPSKFFFYPAQFWPHKNHNLLLRAIAILKKTIPDVALVLSGGFNHDYKKIYNLSLSLGLKNNITFVGYIPDSHIRGFYIRARALVMPTFFGPTNIPPLEALACNCPIAVSKIYGMPDQLGNSAMYFNPNSVDELVNVLEILWEDDSFCHELIEIGIKWSNSWNFKKFSIQLKQIIDNIYIKEKI